MATFRVVFDDHELRLVSLDQDTIIEVPDDRADDAVKLAEGESWSELVEFYAELQSEGIDVRELPGDVPATFDIAIELLEKEADHLRGYDRRDWRTKRLEAAQAELRALRAGVVPA